MKVSVITSVYNNANYIKTAIESVLSQTYKNIEYIIIDGGSTDGTIDIINGYKDKVNKFISERDKGIYDGLNKGIAMATGDAIGFLHSDDIYIDCDVIKRVVEAFQTNRCDSVYGDIVYIDRVNQDKIIRYWKSGKFSYNKLKRGWVPPHTALFVKRDVYSKYGLFDLDYKISADYDFMLRIFGKYRISSCYIHEILCKMRAGGASNNSIKNLILKSKEDLRALKENNIGGLNTLISKKVLKIPQFLNKKGRD
ncbi:MAG: glycosyltransferase family 2 protein [Burkholderiales bacterium]